MAQRRLVWPAVLLLATAAVSAVTYLHVWPSARPVAALPFLVVCPGLAWTRVLRVGATFSLLLGVALSFALDTIVSTALLYAHVPSARASLAVLVAITLGGLAADPDLRALVRGRALPGGSAAA
jgi:hypothetical protein